MTRERLPIKTLCCPECPFNSHHLKAGRHGVFDEVEAGNVLSEGRQCDNVGCLTV